MKLIKFSDTIWVISKTVEVCVYPINRDKLRFNIFAKELGYQTVFYICKSDLFKFLKAVMNLKDLEPKKFRTKLSYLIIRENQ